MEEHRHTDMEIIERLIRVEERLIAADKAIKLAGDAMNSRLEGMNEFRETLQDQASRFITRDEHDIVKEELASLREFKAAVQSKASQSSVYVAWALAVLAILARWVK